MKLRTLALLLPLALLGACDFFFDPYPEQWGGVQSQANFYADIVWGDIGGPPTLPDTAAPRMLVMVNLSAGRAVESPQAEVAGRTIALRSQGGDFWRAEETIPGSWAATPDSVYTVVPPVVPGLQPSPERLRFVVWGREGPRTLVVRPGEDVTLRLRPPPTGVAADFPLHWSLNVSGPGASFNLNGSGRPPASLRIPSENLVGSGPFVASVSVGHQLAPQPFPPQHTAYVVFGNVRSQIHWRIERAPS